MSTRCNIIIKDAGHRFVLYHHHDGYPMGVGTCLREYLEKNWSEPWRTSWRFCGSSMANDLIKKKSHAGATITTEDDEYEICSGLHGDIEYCYVINCQAKTLRCYSVPLSCKGSEHNYETWWPGVFLRRNLCHIPTIEERNAEIARLCNE